MQTQQLARGRIDGVVRFAAVLALVVALGLIGGFAWMVWYGNRQHLLGGYIFIGLLPFFLGLGMLFGVRRMLRGDPGGAAIVRAELWIPLSLFAAATVATLFVADPEDKMPFAAFFAVVTVLLTLISRLMSVAENRLTGQPPSQRQPNSGTGPL
jgi:hypothetical protein